MRFTPARTYLSSSAVALGLAVFSGWCALKWWPAAIPAALFLIGGSLVLYLALKPAIEVTESALNFGKHSVPWSDIRRVDQTGWISPMIVDLTLVGERKLRLVYPGETVNSNRLLRLIQQRSSQALINGVPWRQIFGAPESPEKPPAKSPRYRLLTESDEAEVERLYQQLRTAGRFDADK
jgi:hypothetical protein